ncbi:MAG: efflux RND transporter permease subunit [Patescibacteria group bacterium]
MILIDAINKNRAKGMDQIDLLVEAGASRLEPMILTNLTTVFGILPIALKDRFWSGMGFTIIFGLVATTFISLFVLKSVYYELYMNPEPSFIRRWYGSLQNMLTKKRKRN